MEEYCQLPILLYFLTFPLLERSEEHPIFFELSVHLVDGWGGPENEEAGGAERGTLDTPWRRARH